MQLFCGSCVQIGCLTLKDMRKFVLFLLIALAVPVVSMTGQTYSALWKQVEEADNKDLPQTKIGVLQKIERKAEAGKDYGQLLKASLLNMQTVTSLSADSLRPAVERLERKEKSTSDVVLKAVYNAILYRIYRDNAQLDDGATPSQTADISKAESYKAKAMADMERLAVVKTSGYVPFVVKGSDSGRLFGDDMLSVIGYETDNYKLLADYYQSIGNRRAACLATIEYVKTLAPTKVEQYDKSEQLHRLDSIITVYGDLDVAGEAAVERFLYMKGCRGVTAADESAYIHHALDRWGSWVRSNELRNAERSLTTPQYRFRLNKGRVMPGEVQKVALENLRGLKSLTVKVYRTDLDGTTTLSLYNPKDYQKISKTATLLPEHTQKIDFEGKADYQLFNDSLALGGLLPGVYMLEVETAPATEVRRRLYFVSDIYAVVLPMPGNKMRYAVVSATTGQPASGASLRLTCNRGYGKEAKTVTLTCNGEGEAVYDYSDGERPDRVYAYTATDKAAPQFYTYGRYQYYGDANATERTELFTDRAIYRPGQTVHMAAIAYRNSGGDNNSAVEGRAVNARIMDANGKTVGEKTLNTDKYGTCSADFLLPQSCLSGVYTLLADGRTASFRVEEYKRPTFQVEFPDVNERYQSGDTLSVKAKAATYAGVPVQGAKVKYTVKRRVAYWWLNCSRYWRKAFDGLRSGDEMIYEGETTTTDDGTFAVTVPMVLPEDAHGTRMFYNFTVLADVTNASGETHNGSLSLPLGTRPTAFSADLADKTLADSLKQITFHLRNAAGNPVNAEVRYYIDDASRSKTGMTEKPCTIGGKLKSGKHRLFAVCEGDTLVQDFVVFSLDDTVPCTDTDDWFYVSDNRFPSNGQPVTLQAGSSAKGLHIIYMVSAGNKLIESGAMDKDCALVNRKFRYNDSYGDALLVAYAWVKNGRIYSHTKTIGRPQKDKTLKLSWSSFRDRLTPGQSEEWTLKVETPEGKPADAQLVATLYDKSLDQITSHSWTFLPLNRLRTPSTQWSTGSDMPISAGGTQSRDYLTERKLNLSHFDDGLWPNGYMSWNFGRRPMRLNRMASRGAAVNLLSVGQDRSFVMEEGAMAKTSLMAKEAAPMVETEDGDKNEGGNAAEGAADVQLRENMNETALFQPSLATGKDGTVKIRFTLPESVTTWRFMGLAHTSDLCYGLIDAEAVAQKDMMVQPNVPRFLRIGDAATIKATVSNTSNTAINGSACMEMIDPETDKVVYSQTVSFRADKEKTATVGFNFTPDDNQSLLICRITAKGNGFCDGEQHYIPVLPDREMVTVTVPFTQHSVGTKTVDIAKLFPTDTKQQKLTIEYTNNPAWMVVQTLPSLGVTESGNAVDQCAVLYSNVLGKALMERSPRVKNVFEMWKQEKTDGTSLTSRLYANEELKDIVLNETPWVADADKETEQKMRLADFFDAAAIKERCSTATEKLQSLQNPDGSWSWWPGMMGNTHITACITEMLVRLNCMAGQQEMTATMLDKAIGYMDKQTVEMVERMKKEERKCGKQTFPGFTSLQYLYLKALDNRKETASVRSACDYLTALLMKENKSQSILEKALSAVVLAKRGYKTKSLEYVQSLKEYSVCTEEAGRYYDTQRATYSWRNYKIPTEVAAIEALSTVTPYDTLTIDEMRRWLLHEKRTQMWDTPINTANAVYAFLLGHAGELASGEQPTIAIDGQKVQLPTATAGIGYVKTAVQQPSGRQLSFKKTSSGTSWGGVYAQYLQKTADIERSESGISVKRELLHSGSTLHVGDRVRVRITIDCERDFDFVQVVDHRAACMEPVSQLSGYANGAYCTPNDNATNYFFDSMAKGRHVLETEYYIDREGRYETGTCTASCAYAPEYRGTAKSQTLNVAGAE